MESLSITENFDESESVNDSSEIQIDTINVSEIISKNETYENYYNKKNILNYSITKFEKAKIIGIRAQMLATGSKPMVEIPEGIINTKDIAEIEFNQKKIPLLIRRYHSDKTSEDYRLEDIHY